MTFLKYPVFRVPAGAYEFTLTFGWLLTLLVTLPLLARLGFWQLERAGERQQARDDLDKVMAQAPVNLGSIQDSDTDAKMVRVLASGKLDWSRQFLLENQVHNTVTGYEVLVPLIYEPGKAILLSRGWIPSTPGDKPNLTQPDKVASDAEITGLAVIPKARLSDYQRDILKQTKGYREMNDNPQLADWPVIIPEEDFTVLASLLELELMPRVLQPQQDLEYGFRRVWQPSLRGPAVNYGYAAQWFGMIVLLLGLMVWFNTRRV